jgi:hypothetical protein
VGDPFGYGIPSLFVTNFGGEPNSFYRNVGGVLFEDAGASTGAGAVGFPSVRWGTHFADFDNDGWPDLYAVGGHLAPRIVRMFARYRNGMARYIEAGDAAYAQPTVLLHNDAGKFVEWKAAGDLARVRMVGRGSTTADVDGDGALDLFVVDLDGPSRLFQNRVGSKKSWVFVEPAAGPDGRTVLGTKVRVTAGGRSQTQWYFVSPSYASGSLVPLHFGLAGAEKIEEIEVTWPGGDKQVFRDVPARRTYRLVRDAGEYDDGR